MRNVRTPRHPSSAEARAGELTSYRAPRLGDKVQSCCATAEIGRRSGEAFSRSAIHFDAAYDAAYDARLLQPTSGCFSFLAARTCGGTNWPFFLRAPPVVSSSSSESMLASARLSNTAPGSAA